MEKDDHIQRSILIVDDEPSNIQLIGKILKKLKHSVAYVLNGKSAIEIVKEKKFDLILLDIMLPDIDGFEVCRVLMENEETREIPVIFITARSEIENVIRGFKVGGVDYVTKPFNELELTARISNQLELKAQKDQLKEYVNALNNDSKNGLRFVSESLEKVSEVIMMLNILNDKSKRIYDNDISGIKKLLNSWSESIKKGENGKKLPRLDDDYWKKIYQLYPGLTPNEKKLCGYLRAGMTTKEISRISSQTIRAVEAARSRLRKKLKLGKDDNLVHFLTQL